MSHRMMLASSTAVVLAVTLAACGGGGSSVPAHMNPAPGPTVSSQQVVTEALPSSAIGVENDPTFGLIGGFTQTVYSQTLAFAPGSQIMIANGQTSTPHTFNVLSTASFPASPALSTSASGGATIASGFASGTVSPGTMAGPFTLTAGTYYIGCAFHYISSTMRTVLVVAAGATPGPQATPAPSSTAPPCQYCY
jgi:hypothetical protein